MEHELPLQAADALAVADSVIRDLSEAVVEDAGDLWFLVLDELVGNVLALGEKLIEALQRNHHALKQIIIPPPQSQHGPLILLQHQPQAQVLLTKLLDGGGPGGLAPLQFQHPLFKLVVVHPVVLAFLLRRVQLGLQVPDIVTMRLQLALELQILVLQAGQLFLQLLNLGLPFLFFVLNQLDLHH